MLSSMRSFLWVVGISLFLVHSLLSAPWTLENSLYNLNQNPHALSPREYAGAWPNHAYFPSPTSWRFPFYTLMLDRFADMDPSNNDIFKTLYEFDPLQTQFRHGGDVRGLHEHLDYLVSLGIKCIYIAGTPFLNEPWDYHSYNPLDFTLLDPHFGTVQDWRDMISAAHARGLYVLLDLTVVTLGDLLSFDG